MKSSDILMPLVSVKLALNKISVQGEENLNGLLASIQTLSRVIDDLRSESEKEGSSNDNHAS